MYDVSIVEREEKKVAAFVLHTTFAENRQAGEIPPFFHGIMEKGTLEQVPDRIDSNQICAIVKEKTSPEFDYFMGVEVSGFENIPDGMKPLTIPACRYAAAAFVKRGNADVLRAFQFIAGKWLPENGHVQNTAVPAFIYYDERFIPVFKKEGYAGNPVAEIYIPI